MSKNLTIINVLWTVADTLICIVGISVFLWATWYFNKWWLLPLAIIPLALFNQHSLVIDSEVETAKAQMKEVSDHSTT